MNEHHPSNLRELKKITTQTECGEKRCRKLKASPNERPIIDFIVVPSEGSSKIEKKATQIPPITSKLRFINRVKKWQKPFGY